MSTRSARANGFLVRRLMVVATLVGAVGVSSYFAGQGGAASLTSTSVTMSNPRLSFVGLTASNTSGTSQLALNTTGGAAPNVSTDGLLPDDTIAVGVSAHNSMTNYTISEVFSSSTLSLDSTLNSVTAASGRNVIATQSATLTARFITATAINGGTIRVLVPAASSTAADGVPDQGFFDYGDSLSPPTVTCPSDVANYDFGSGTAAASNVTINSQVYHAYNCAYTGTGGIGTDFTSNPIVINDVINPAPKADHTVGSADSHRLIIQHLNGSSAVVDSTTVAVGVIEPVRVTATVAPQISFSLAANSSGATRCGQTTTATTTAITVPFGELTIGTPAYAAQTATVSTNAPNGYAVTVLENDQMGRNANTCTGNNTGADCIPDSTGDDGTTMSHTTIAKWSSNSVYGLAYSMQSVSGSPTLVFTHSTSSGACDGTSGTCYKQFADAEDSQAAQSVFSNSTVTSGDSVYMCYKVNVSAAQAAGNYENNLIYNATATF